MIIISLEHVREMTKTASGPFSVFCCMFEEDWPMRSVVYRIYSPLNPFTWDIVPITNVSLEGLPEFMVCMQKTTVLSPKGRLKKSLKR